MAGHSQEEGDLRHKTGPEGQRVWGEGPGAGASGTDTSSGVGVLWAVGDSARLLLLTAPATGREPVRMEIFPGGLCLP